LLQRARIAGVQAPGSAVRVSLLRYSPAVVLLAIAIADSARFADPDLWGHLVFGRDILASGHAPIVDSYSYSAFSRPWVDHEWLSEAAMALAFGAGGVVGLKMLKLALTAVVIVTMALAIGETGASAALQLAILLPIAVRLSIQLQFRPQMFTFAMLSALLALLARENYRRAAPMWIAVPMLALWSNLHGGFVVGLAALYTFAAVSCIADGARGRGGRRAMTLAVVAFLATLATLATPYGLGTWRAVAHTVIDPGAVSAISEWHPLLRHLIALAHPMGVLFFYDLCATLLFAAFVISIALTPRLDDLPLDAVGAIMVVAAFSAVRNVPLGLIACAAPLARHASLALARFHVREGASVAAPAAASTIMSRANQLVIAAIALILLAQTRLFSTTLDVPQRYPAGAVAFMRSHDLGGNVLADYSWNDYLLYHLGGRSRVFLDSRYETIYPDSVTRDFLDFNGNRPRAASVLASYPHDFVLITPDSRSAVLMESNAGWKPIYRDDASILYARIDSAAAHLPGVPITATATPATFP
jgi:hypothetical protein